MTEEELALELRYAWAAGIIDGEGSICIGKKSGGYYSLVMAVGQSGPTIPPMLIELRSLFGGSMPRLSPTQKDGWARQPHWHKYQNGRGMSQEGVQVI